MAQVLISGGAGFIGSHLACAVLDGGYSLAILDNMDPYYPPAVKERNLEVVSSHGRFDLIRGSICDAAAVSKAVSTGTEVIFHEAAQAGVRASVENPAKTSEVNATGTLNILVEAKRKKVPQVVSASSSSVYGKVVSLPFTEDHPLQPISPYGASKVVAEQYCSVFARLFSMNTVSLRYFTVYGPRMRPDLAIPIFTRSLLNGKAPEMFGDGEQTRDYTHVDDIVRCNMDLIGRDGLSGRAVNVGFGKRHTMNDVLNALQSALKTDIEPVHLPEKQGDARHTWADNSLARRELGFEPRYDIKSGLASFAEWYGANRGFYDAP